MYFSREKECNVLYLQRSSESGKVSPFKINLRTCISHRSLATECRNDPDRHLGATMTIYHCPQVYLSNCSLTAVDRTAFTSLALMIELDLSNNKVFLEPIELMLELKLSHIILASLERMSLSIEYPIKYPIQYPNLTRPTVP